MMWDEYLNIWSVSYVIDHAFNLVMQKSIAQQVNENPEAGWEADINPRFSNYTVSL